MVESAKRTRSPVIGYRQVREASRSSSARSCPRDGGAASSCPITEKRRCAQRSCTEGSFALPMSASVVTYLPDADTVIAAAAFPRRASSAGEAYPRYEA